MAESFGTRLRQERERRQIALTTIVERTKINLSLLEGLERDDVSHWPFGIFRRSFIRSYAQAVGLDPDPVVREFLELYPDPPDAVIPVAGGESPGERPPMRLRYLISSAMRSPGGVVQKLGSAIGSAMGVAPAPTIATSDAVAEPSPAEPASLPVDRIPETRRPQPAIVDRSPSSEPALDLTAAADLCTQLGRVLDPQQMPPLLEAAAKVLDAVGLVVWVSDPPGTRLSPALAYGYSEELIAQLPSLRREADNATATAFRSAQTRIVNGSDQANGAVVIPLMSPGGCVGVLAAELRHGGERRESVRALATIFAAQLATLVAVDPLAEAMRARA